jgi:hypothetical protein
MIVIENLLISEDIIEKKFVCDIARCKGACCEEGAAGAPLEEEEKQIIDDVFETVKPYLCEQYLTEIDKKGKYVHHEEFGWVTPTVDADNEICAFAIRRANGVIHCAFEQAYLDGKISWKKPVSCHLYPIVAKKGKYGDYERLNYEPRTEICKPGCLNGEALQVPVYAFLREPIVRKYGEEVYKALDTIAKGDWEEIDFKE